MWEEVRGDLEEAFAEDVDARGAFRANITYWVEVLLFIRSHTIRKRESHQQRGSIMWTNYATVAVRVLRKQRSFSVINLLGLAVGLACTFFITQYVRHERSFDSYHEDAHLIYRMIADNEGDEYDGIAKINGAWGVRADKDIPAIESIARFTFFGQAQFEVGDRKEYVSGGFFADSTTFDVFSWSVELGDAQTALVEPNSIVLTRSLASSWFGEEDPRGRQITINGSLEVVVTAVMEDVPENSHFRFPFLVSYASYTDERHDGWVAWNQYYTYLKLADGANPVAVGEEATSMLGRHMTSEEANAFGKVKLQPLSDIYLRSHMFREIAATGNERSVSILMMLGLFILFLAAINFINLSTARSSLRAREVGVRKNLGARKGNLIGQFLSESVLMVLFAALLAAGLVVASYGWFNDISGKTFSLSQLFSADILPLALGSLLVLGLLSGLYPAFVLSSFNPLHVMKGQTAMGKGLGMRRSLVVVQFAISAALIMGTALVGGQMKYVRTLELGFEKENIVGIPFRDPELLSVRQAIRDEMARVPGVESIALSANRPGGGDYGIPIEIPGLTREETPPVRMLVADYDYTKVYGIELVDGRTFSPEFPSDENSGVLINETLVRELGWEDPIGMAINMPAVGRAFEVIGVMKDFHFRSLHESITPLILFMAPDEWYSMLNVRIGPENLTSTLEALAAIYERYDVNNPMAYSFMDETLNELYLADQRIAELLSVFTWLAILIACLGLFGLTAFTAEQRRAEIGVRKVLGASASQIVALLSKEIAVLVGIAVLLAIPFVVYSGQQWLDSFAYSTGIGVSTIGLGILITALFAFATTGLQAYKAARMNPVRAIRTD